MSSLLSVAALVLAAGASLGPMVDDSPGLGETYNPAQNLVGFEYTKSGGFLGDSLKLVLTRNGIAIAERERFGRKVTGRRQLSDIEARWLQRWVGEELRKVRIALWDCGGADLIHHRFEAMIDGRLAAYETCAPDEGMVELIAAVEDVAARALAKDEEDLIAEILVVNGPTKHFPMRRLALYEDGTVRVVTRRCFVCTLARAKIDAELAKEVAKSLKDLTRTLAPRLPDGPCLGGPVRAHLDLREPNVLALLRREPFVHAFVNTLASR